MGVGNRDRIVLAAKHRAEKEFDRADRLVDRGVGKVAFSDPVQQPRLDLHRIEPIRAAVVVARQLRHHRNVALLRASGQAAQHHRVDHLLT